MIAAQLYDSLDREFREKSLRYAAKYTSLSKTGSTVNATVTEADGGRFKVTLTAADSVGQLLSCELVVNSRQEAENIKNNYTAKPDAVYRGILFSATGRLEFLS
jgi:hypothetical protein